MVGRSRRFMEAGYTQPKYRLLLAGQSVFSLAVGSFQAVAQHEDLLIVCLAEDKVADFARAELARIGIHRGRVVELPKMTAGQADTVSQGLTAAAVSDDEPVLIFNIDTFRPGFRYPTSFDVTAVDGYLECFVGSGANWSNAVPDAPGSSRVIRTSEKLQESEFCCTGLYYFSSVRVFNYAYRTECEAHRHGDGQANELYVAPIYNHLIQQGAVIRFEVVSLSQVLFCGVPAEFEALRDQPPMPLVSHASQLASGPSPGRVRSASPCE